MIDKGYTLDIPPHGYVRYVDHLGTDKRIVEAARVSYGSAASKGDEADKKLIFYLFRNRHTSPFEQCNITFNIKMPIFVMRQLVRHRTFRLNEMSGRYTEFHDEFYYPEVWRVQDTKNKQGSLVDASDATWHKHNSIILKGLHQHVYRVYQSLLLRGVAKELARIVLPVSIYTEIYVNIDLHNLMHFLTLRLDEHAQLEIRQVARPMWHIMAELFPWTFEAFQKYKFKVEVATLQSDDKG